MFKVYRSLTPIDINDPPEPIAVDLVNTSFIDSDVVLGDRFYYRVSATKNGIEKFSDEVLGIAGEIDEYFANVQLLIFADADTFPSVAFFDSSSFARTVTYANSAQIVSPSVFAPEFDQGSIRIPASGGRVDSNLPSFGVEDLTIECHAALSSTKTGNRTLWQFGTATGAVQISTDSSRRLWLSIFMVYQYLGLIIGGEMVLNQWYHVCLMRKNGIFYLFIDGVIIGTNSNYATQNIPAGKFSIGNYPDSVSVGSSWNGFVSGMRVTKGVARYDVSGFTPPSAKYPN